MPLVPRIVIDESQFRDLVAGKPLTHQLSRRRSSIEIVLSNGIGWVRLVRAVLDAIAPSPASISADQPPPPDPPQAREFLSRRTKRNNHR